MMRRMPDGVVYRRPCFNACSGVIALSECAILFRFPRRHEYPVKTMLTTVAIVEDNRDFRDTLARYVDEAPGCRCLCTCGTAEEALQKIPRLLPQVVLMDVHLPSMSGVDCTRKLKILCPSVQV